MIEATIPPAFGTRRHRLFLLARRIRGDEQLSQIPLRELKPLVRKWHQQALATIRTKEFDETWIDFVEAYQNVDQSRCGDAALMAMALVDATDLPPEAMGYSSPLTRRLVGLCAELSRTSADGEFYLSCRKAAGVLGVIDHKLVNRTLRMLCLDGVLLVTKTGGPHNNLAHRYRYFGTHVSPNGRPP